jgi:hypothetical protein
MKEMPLATQVVLFNLLPHIMIYIIKFSYNFNINMLSYIEIKAFQLNHVGSIDNTSMIKLFLCDFVGVEIFSGL